jgi:ankyrin repeat protein
MYAAGHAHPRMVRWLLDNGADARVVAKDGWTALRVSLMSGNPQSIESDEPLILAGAMQGEHYLLWGVGDSGTSAGHMNVLMRHGVDPNERATDGSTALIDSAYEGDTPAVIALVEHGAKINIVDNEGRTALSRAVEQGNDDVVQYLLRHGADATMKIKGQSLLQIAAAKRDWDYQHGAIYAYPHYDTIIAILKKPQ